MQLCGLADSFACVADSVEKCLCCGTALWVRQDLCIGCLLHSGLTVDSGDVETLDTLLAEVQMPEVKIAREHDIVVKREPLGRDVEQE